MTRIAQLTDIHVADFSDMRTRDFLTKRATGYVNYVRKRAKEYDPVVLSSGVNRIIEAEPDLVVVSGDLSNLGLRSEWARARAALRPLMDAGLEVAVIPGNHDYYMKESARGRFEDAWSDLQSADSRLDDEVYPFVRRFGSTSVLLMNSAIPTLPLFAYGKVSEGELERARKLLRQEAASGQHLVVAVHHHPIPAVHKRFDYQRNLRNASAVRQLAVSTGVKVIMHGHNHWFHVARIGDARGPVVSGLSCSTTNRKGPAPRRGQIGLYDISDEGVLDLRVAEWRAEDEAFSDWRSVDLHHLPVNSI